MKLYRATGQSENAKDPPAREQPEHTPNTQSTTTAYPPTTETMVEFQEPPAVSFEGQGQDSYYLQGSQDLATETALTLNRLEAVRRKETKILRGSIH